MKSGTIIFLLSSLVCLNTYCQKDRKFNYEPDPYGRNYIITLKSEKTISKEARSVSVLFTDHEWLNDTYFSIIEKSIGPEKLQKLTGLRGGYVSITFSPMGKVLKITIYIHKENIDVLSENDLYTLYDNLRKTDMDMSKVELEYPQDWVQGTEAFWAISFPLKRNKK